MAGARFKQLKVYFSDRKEALGFALTRHGHLHIPQTKAKAAPKPSLLALAVAKMPFYAA